MGRWTNAHRSRHHCRHRHWPDRARRRSWRRIPSRGWSSGLGADRAARANAGILTSADRATCTTADRAICAGQSLAATCTTGSLAFQLSSRYPRGRARRSRGLDHPRQERAQQRGRGYGPHCRYHRQSRRAGARGHHRLRRLSRHRHPQDCRRLAGLEFRPCRQARHDYRGPYPQPGAPGAGIQAR